MPQQYDLTNEYVSSTYNRIVQIISSSLYDGLGNNILVESSSYARNASTASYFIGNIVSSSYSLSSSISNNSLLSISSSYSDTAKSASYAPAPATSSYSLSNLSSSYALFTPNIQTIGARISTEDSYITAGSKGYKHIGYPCNIIKTRTITENTGSIDINIRRNNILLGNINIVNTTGSYDNILTGWTTQLNEDDLIEFYVSGSSIHITDITIFLDLKSRQI